MYVIGILRGLLSIMDVFSLEEDDCSELFITQSDPKVVQNSGESDECNNGASSSGSFMSLLMSSSSDFPQYEDISDDDDFEIPSSQIRTQSQG